MRDETPFNEEKLTIEKRQQIAKLTPLDRQALIKNILVRYPRFKEMSAFVSKFHRPVVNGTHGTGQLGAILGESRSGKSIILQAYKQDFPVRDGKFARIRPVIYAEIRDDMTAFDVIDTIAKQVGYLSTPKVKVATYIDMVIEALPHHQVELVILDDVDNALKAPRSIYAKHIFSFMKGLLDQQSCNLLCSGRPHLWDILHHKEQLEGRGGLPHATLHPYRWSVRTEREQVSLLLDGIDNRLPFKAKSGLAAPEIAAHFYLVSHGLIGRMMNYITDAAHEAINDEADCIERKHLIYAAKRRMQAGTSFVPFQDELDPDQIEAGPQSLIVDSQPKPGKIPRDTFSKSRPGRSA